MCSDGVTTGIFHRYVHIPQLQRLDGDDRLLLPADVIVISHRQPAHIAQHCCGEELGRHQTGESHLLVLLYRYHGDDLCAVSGTNARAFCQ